MSVCVSSVSVRADAKLPTQNLCAKLTPDSGAQPLVNDDGSIALAVNGEIYNHRILRKGLKKQYNFKTHSDCEVIIPLVCPETFHNIAGFQSLISFSIWNMALTLLSILMACFLGFFMTRRKTG
jgi:hypothetical protein